MAKYAFEKVVCEKCGREYAVTKGSTKAFHCPGSRCHQLVGGKPEVRPAASGRTE